VECHKQHGYPYGCQEFVLDKVVSATFILNDESDFAGMDEAWMKHG
jgi:hypothetical protein